MTSFRRVEVRGSVSDVDLTVTFRHLEGGGLVVYPTETVYGMGCLLQRAPLQTLARFKSRGPASPFLLLVSGREAVSGLVWTAAARELARIFWPGALTLVLSDPGGRFPGGVRNAKGGVAVRQSPHPVAAALVEGIGQPLVSTSANAHGEAPATRAAEALAVAERVGAGPETLLLDAGDLSWSPPSTIVDCTGPVPVVVRTGSVPVERLRCVLPEIHGSEHE